MEFLKREHPDICVQLEPKLDSGFGEGSRVGPHRTQWGFRLGGKCEWNIKWYKFTKNASNFPFFGYKIRYTIQLYFINIVKKYSYKIYDKQYNT